MNCASRGHGAHSSSSFSATSSVPAPSATSRASVASQAFSGIRSGVSAVPVGQAARLRNFCPAPLGSAALVRLVRLGAQHLNYHGRVASTRMEMNCYPSRALPAIGQGI